MLFYALFLSIVWYYVLSVNVLYYCNRVSKQLQLSISYHIISYHIISYHISYHIIPHRVLYCSAHFLIPIFMPYIFTSIPGRALCCKGQDRRDKSQHTFFTAVTSLRNSVVSKGAKNMNNGNCSLYFIKRRCMKTHVTAELRDKCVLNFFRTWHVTRPV